MLLSKFGASLAVGIAIWVLTEYGFGGTSGGGDGSNWSIAFLNAGSNSKQQTKQAIADKIKSMNATEVTNLLAQLQNKSDENLQASNKLQ